MMHKTFMLLGLLGVLAAGCVIDTARYPYDRCYTGDACSGGTACLTAMYSVSGAPGSLCTAGCTSGTQCPVSSYYSKYAPTCVYNSTTRQGLCYNSCIGSGDCYFGTTCVAVPGTGVGPVPLVRICVPST